MRFTSEPDSDMRSGCPWVSRLASSFYPLPWCSVFHIVPKITEGQLPVGTAGSLLNQSAHERDCRNNRPGLDTDIRSGCPWVSRLASSSHPLPWLFLSLVFPKITKAYLPPDTFSSPPMFFPPLANTDVDPTWRPPQGASGWLPLLLHQRMNMYGPFSDPIHRPTRRCPLPMFTSATLVAWNVRARLCRSI